MKSKKSESFTVRRSTPVKTPPSTPSSNNPAATATYEKCIQKYQKEIKTLNARIQELQQRLENSDEPNSSLVQSYRMVQAENNKLLEENNKLKKTIIKQSQSQNQN